MAADTALFVGWNRALEGREMQAVEVFNAWNGWLSKQQEAGRIEGFEIAFLHPHGGDLNGFTLVRGTRDQLNALRATEDFQDLEMRANINVQGFGVIEAWIGSGIATTMTRYLKAFGAK